MNASDRINVTLPAGIYDRLKSVVEFESRPLSGLAAYILEA